MAKSIVNDIVDSCDWSTSGNICTTCIVDDLKRGLEPIVEKLQKIEGIEAAEAVKALKALYVADVEIKERVFTDKVTKAAQDLYRIGYDGDIQGGLRRLIEPIALTIEKTGVEHLLAIGKELREVYALPPSKETVEDIQVDPRAPTLQQLIERRDPRVRELWR